MDLWDGKASMAYIVSSRTAKEQPKNYIIKNYIIKTLSQKEKKVGWLGTVGHAINLSRGSLAEVHIQQVGRQRQASLLSSRPTCLQIELQHNQGFPV